MDNVDIIALTLILPTACYIMIKGLENCLLLMTALLALVPLLIIKEGDVLYTIMMVLASSLVIWDMVGIWKKRGRPSIKEFYFPTEEVEVTSPAPANEVVKPDKWIPFYFEGNQAFGDCDNRADWVEIVKEFTEYDEHYDWEWVATNALRLKDQNDSFGFGDDPEEYDRPTFGLYYEHQGESLLSWANRNGVNLEVL